MDLHDLIESFPSYDSDNPIHEKYGDWTVSGILDELEKITVKYKNLKTKLSTTVNLPKPCFGRLFEMEELLLTLRYTILIDGRKTRVDKILEKISKWFAESDFKTSKRR